MALTRILSPEDRIQHSIDTNACFPVGSPVPLIYESEVTGTASKANGTITILNHIQIVEGYQITVAGQTFTATATPKTGQLPIYPTAISDILEALYVALISNPYINDRYSVVYTGLIITITARAQGSLFNFVMNQTGTGFATAIANGNNAYDAQGLVDYGVVVDVFIDQRVQNRQYFLSIPAIERPSSDFELVDKPLEKRYGGINRFEFDLSEILQNYVRSRVPQVQDVLTLGVNFQPSFDMVVRFAYIVSETWTDNGLRRRVAREIVGFNETTDTVKKSFWGVRSSERKEYTYNDSYIAYYQRWRGKVLGGGNRPIFPLTHQPRQKSIRRDTLEFLYFVYDRPQSDALEYDFLRAHVVFEFEDCTTTETIIGGYYVDSALIQSAVFSCEVSPRVFDLNDVESTEGKQIKSYTVVIRAYNYLNPIGDYVEITQPQTYILRNDVICTDQQPILLFLNPLGGFDTLCPNGNIVKDVAVDFSEYEKTLKHDIIQQFNSVAYPDYYKVSEKGSFAADTVVSYEMNSGWIDKVHFDWLRDLIQSNEVYIIDPAMDRETRTLTGWQPRKVRIDSSNFQRSSADDSYNMKLKVELTVNRNNLAG